MQALGDLALDAVGRGEARLLARICRWWYGRLPPRLTARIRPHRVANGTLWVTVPSSAHVQELRLLEADILAAAQRDLRGVQLQQLRAQVGRQHTRPSSLPPPPEKDYSNVALTLPRDVSQALEGVEDKALRDCMTRAARASLAAAR